MSSSTYRHGICWEAAEFRADEEGAKVTGRVLGGFWGGSGGVLEHDEHSGMSAGELLSCVDVPAQRGRILGTLGGSSFLCWGFDKQPRENRQAALIFSIS